MHDFTFAVLKAAQIADRRWSALSVAQSLRDSLQRAGRGARSDAQVLAFSERLTEDTLAVADSGWSRIQERHWLPRSDQVAASPAPGVSLSPDGPPELPPMPVLPVPPYDPDAILLREREARRKRQEENAREDTITVASRGKRHVVDLFRLGKERQRNPPTSSGGAGLPECCVIDFEYPLDHPYFWMYRSPGDPGGKYRAGWRFEARAQYNPAGGCDCTCCQFVQYVVPLELKVRGKPARLRTYSNDPVGIEDCLWYELGDIVNGVVPPQKLRKVLEEAPPVDNPNVRYVCYGRDNEAGEGSISSYYHTQCLFEMCDAPNFVWTPLDDPIESVKLYVGEIYDTCRPKLKRREIIQLSLNLTSSGLVGSWRHQAADGTPAGPDNGGTAYPVPTDRQCS